MAWRALLLIACVSVATCGGKPPNPTPPPSGERITGSERLGWDQEASNAAELASLHYAIYADGVRSELADATCAPAQAGFACSARLPTLSPGPHTLELVSYVSDVGVVESRKSAPLMVTVGAALAFSSPTAFDSAQARDAVSAFGRTVVTEDGVRLKTEIVADGLTNPTDLAFAPDGRIFIAERGGAVRVVRDGRLDASTTGVVDEVDTRGGGGLLAFALAPDFARTGHIFVIHTATGADGTLVFRMARFREVNGTLGDRAVLLDGIPAAPVQPRASLRFGSDGKLYVAFDDGGDERLGSSWSSYAGKVLRLNADGTTPSGQASPIVRQGLRSPRGLAWAPAGATLWVADSRIDAEQVTSASSGVVLPRLTGAAALAVYRSARIPRFQNDVLVAGSEGRILRLRVSAADPGKIESVENLLEAEGLGPLRVVAASPAGEIYFSTETALGRLVP